MTEYSFGIEDDFEADLEVNSVDDLLSLLKCPTSDLSEEINYLSSGNYLLKTSDGQILYITYSVDSEANNNGSLPAIFFLQSKEPQLLMTEDDDDEEEGRNILAFNHSELSPSNDNIVTQDDEEEDLDTEVVLKVEDRLKVFDAVLAPAENKVKPKPRIKTVKNKDAEEKNNPNGNIYVCDLCGSSFNRAVQYYGHLHRHSGEHTWKCQYCPEGTSFSTQSILRRHEKKYHFNLRPHSCTECGATFDRPSQLDYHKRRIHDGERPFGCQLCGKAFFKHSDLRTHLNTHLSVHGCICEVCGRRFSHVSNLTRHMRTHSGVKPYPCSICGRRFNQLNSLSGHKSSHRNQVPVTCCGKTFKTQLLLRRHLKFVHNNSLNPLKQTCRSNRKFHCKVCGNSFPYLALLRKHEMTHDKFICSSCKKESSNLDEFKNHSCHKEKTCDISENFLCSHDVSDVYLDSDTDWIDAGSEFDSFSDSNHLPGDSNLSVPKSLSCSVLDIDKLVKDTYSGTEDERFERAQLDKFVKDTCEVSEVHSLVKGSFSDAVDKLVKDTFDQPNLQLSDSLPSNQNSDDTSIETDSLVISHPICMPSLKPNSEASFALSAITVLTPQHSNDRKNQLNRDVFQRSTVFPEHTMVKDNITLIKGSYEVDEDSILKDNDNNSEKKDMDLINVKAEKDVKTTTSKNYICSVCGKRFLKSNNYKQHLGIHDVGRQLYTCEICKKSFAWKSTLNKHILTHSDNPNPPLFPCENCDKLYSTSSLLQAHINRDHLMLRPHVCSLCNKKFFKKHDLKIHFRIHTQERPYICGTCGKTFNHISHLLRHERIHNGDRPYQCSYCPASFVQSSALTSHLKHHASSESNHSVSLINQIISINNSHQKI